jgi:hypothetical protein
MPTLTFLDLIGVQAYIYGSNRLRHVVGASHLASRVTSRDVLGDPGHAFWRGADVPEPEVLSAAGGNAVLGFAGSDDARRYARAWSRRLHDEAPGLEAEIAHREYEPGGLARALDKGFALLAERKAARAPGVALLGEGVAASCPYTGLPAIEGTDGEVSAGREAARQASGEATDRSGGVLASLPAPDGPAEWSLALEDLGATLGERSLAGVVHLDGNRIGARIQGWLSGARDKPDDEVKREYEEWSSDLDGLGQAAQKGMLEALARTVRSADEPARIETPAGGFTLPSEDGRIMLPARPILLGGDDLTFICDGRVALSCARHALEAFAGKPEVRHLGKVGACAGVAVVGHHSPFSRAYALADQLCRSAKDHLAAGQSGPVFALDWHLGDVRPGVALGELRKTNYGGQTARPYLLRDWKRLEEILDEPGKGLRAPGGWAEQRSKAKTLGRLALEGDDAVKRGVARWRLPQAAQENRAFSLGEASMSKVLADAVELMDVHLPLDELPGGDEG